MMKKLQTREFMPLGISIILMVISIGVVVASNTVFNNEHYWGIVTLIVSSVLFFRNQRAYLFFYGSTILLGLIGLVDFFYMTIKIGFGTFQVNPIFLLLLLLFSTTSEKIQNKLFPK